MHSPLQLLAHVASSTFSRIADLCEETRTQLEHSESADFLLREAASRRFEVVLFEWGGAADRHAASEADRLLHELLWQSRSPIVLYTELTTDTARRLLRLGPATVCGVLFEGIDDATSELFQLRLIEADIRRLSRGLARAVAERAAAWPPHLRDALVRAFVAPASAASIDHLERASNLTRRSIDRWCCRSGLATMAVLLSSARIAFVYGRLQHGTETWSRLARLSGARSARQLSADLRVVCRMEHVDEIAELPFDTARSLLEAAIHLEPPARLERSG